MNKTKLSPQERKILNSMFLRSHLTFMTFNMVKMEANAFTITMAPALEAIYKDDEEGLKQAVLRHQNFFNTHVVPFSFIAGLTYAMEKEYKEKGSIDPTTINNIKAALMGPTAGMFDSLFYNSIRVIAAGIAIEMCNTGNFLGAVVFILLFGVPQSILKYLFINWGYTLGTSFIDRIFNSGLMSALVKAAAVLGVIMIGAMTAQMVSVPVSFNIMLNQQSVNIGEVFYSVVPAALGVGLLFGLIALIKKKWHPTWLIVLVLALGMIGALCGIFAV